MIHYAVRCDQDHQFDGWFRSSAAFDAQSLQGLVACPVCGSSAVRRALMTPSVVAGRGEAPPPVIDQTGSPAPTPAPMVQPDLPSPPPKSGAELPDQVRAALQRLRADVERHCEDVGPRFAEEARAIHNGESDKRGIYGETTPDEARALAEDGIEIARLPWVPRADS